MERKMIGVANGFCHGCKYLGSWKGGYVWRDDEKYLVEEDPDIEAFFSQEALPYLLPDNAKYIDAIESDEDPHLLSKLHWALAYLHHRNPNVVVDLLRADFPFNLYPLHDEVIWFLLDPHKEVAEEAAKVIWKLGFNLESVLNRVARQQERTGVSKIQSFRACELLRQYCPEEKKAELESALKQES